MPEKPVAKLALDTRAHGPYFCEKCDAENEDALLMTDASVVCPECLTPMEEFQPFTDVIVSAAPVQGAKSSGKPAAGRKQRWIIEWTNIDSSQDATTAYDTKEEAFKVAADWIKETAQRELDSQEFDMSDDYDKAVHEQFTIMLDDLKKGDQRSAISQWLDYQGEFEPDEKMAIGPSGNVCERQGDFDYLTT